MTTAKHTPTSQPIAALAELGTSVWLDSFEPGHDRVGGSAGPRPRCCWRDANPAIFEKAISGGGEYDEPLSDLAGRGLDVVAAYEALAVEDVRAAADVLRGVYERSDHRDGTPVLRSRRIWPMTPTRRWPRWSTWRRLDRPNVMIKIPGTAAGAEAIRGATAAGVNVNVTLLFSVDAYAQVADAYLAGLEERGARGEPDARRTLGELREAGVNLEQVTAQLLVEGIAAFDVAMGKLLASIERRRG